MCVRGDGDCSVCCYNYNVTCDYCGEEVHFCDSTGMRYPNYVLCSVCEEDTAECCDCGERYAVDEMYEYSALDNKDLSKVIFIEYQCPQCFENDRVVGCPVEDVDYKLTRKPKEEINNG